MFLNFLSFVIGSFLVAGLSKEPIQEQPSEPDPKAEKSPKTIQEFTKSFRRLEGFITVYLDIEKGLLWAELPPPGADSVCMEALYVEALRSGLGSNPIGLDRGQLGSSSLVRLKRLGNKVLFEVPNLAYRAVTNQESERRAVEESFVRSVIWGAEAKMIDEDGRSLIDMTPFLLRDAHGIIPRLQASGEGSYALEGNSCALDFSNCVSFPSNIEIETVLTYRGSKPGREVRSVAPHAEALSFLQHHSFIELPDDHYEKRRFDPRCGSSSISYADYATPIRDGLRKHWVTRHRLQQNGLEDSLTYYVDSGAPEPIRSALVEGASWWTEAFAAAGFPDGFRVEVLPEGVHPLDVRYNVIQWVHRATRGWSYGASIIDPRTGEILKGHVSLGSLRVRQDRLIFDGLFGADSLSNEESVSEKMALARIRQLAAHEVGHTLGLVHNFAASTYGNRASVMDYPAPLIKVRDDGSLDGSDAYGVGIGPWDRQAIRYLYTEFKDTEEEEVGLRGILRESRENHWIHLSDGDARPASAAHPLANLWDNGEDTIHELKQVMRVRRHALQNLGIRSLRDHQPLAELHEVFVPVYLFHRYQAESVAKYLGGHFYDYAVVGEDPLPSKPVPHEEQRRALEALLACLTPEALTIPTPLLRSLVPRPPGYSHHRELFQSRTGLVFDFLGTVETAAELVLSPMLNAERLERMIQTALSDDNALVVDELLAMIWGRLSGERSDRESAAVSNRVARVFVDLMIELSVAEKTSPSVRALLRIQLEKVHRDSSASSDPFKRLVGDDILAYFEGKPRPMGRRHGVDPAPPGSPIGSSCGCFFHDLLE